MFIDTIVEYSELGMAFIGTAVYDFISSFYINPGRAFGVVRWTGTINIVVNIISALVILVISLAVLYFLWGVSKYIISDDVKKREEAIKVITYGVIVIFVMVSMWSLVFVIGRTFGLGSNQVPREEIIDINRLIR
jgi:hypothetical protein